MYLFQKKKVQHETVKTIKEGQTYESNTYAAIDAPDIEPIQQPQSLSDAQNFVVFDIETTGLSRSSDIVQI
jgi:uncharacterized protein YprB with RNaseH-like and TPR domain